ncbi:MAG TPA: hypothetical protein VIQ02_11820, partial [Jiangellaceae bacterium]
DGPVAGTGRWVAANARWLRIAVGVLGAIVLLWGNEASPARLLWSLVLVVVLLGIVQVLVGAGRETAATKLEPATRSGTAVADAPEPAIKTVGGPGGSR